MRFNVPFIKLEVSCFLCFSFNKFFHLILCIELPSSLFRSFSLCFYFECYYIDLDLVILVLKVFQDNLAKNLNLLYKVYNGSFGCIVKNTKNCLKYGNERVLIKNETYSKVSNRTLCRAPKKLP